ncbi:MAG: Gldg family protein [Clostridia bacterium]
MNFKNKNPKVAKKPLPVNANKLKYSTTASIFTVLFIVIVIAVNVFSSALVERFPSLNADLTSDGLYSLSDESKEVAQSIELETEIILIGEQDYFDTDAYYSDYGLKYSQVSALAEKFSEANSNITVTYVDPDLQPQLISEYSSESLTDSMVLIRTDLRYVVLSVTDFFSVTQDETTYEYFYYSMVDGAIANAINIVNLETVPTIAVATGHDETLSTDVLTTFDALVEDNGFVINEFDIVTEEIPEEADIVFIPTPTTDYSVEEIAKLRVFLSNEIGNKTIMITCYPTQEQFPNLYSFLEEWGIIVNEGVVLESDSSNYMSGYSSQIFVDVNADNLPDAEAYSSLVSYVSVPITFAYDANDNISTFSFVETADTAYISVDGSEMDDPATGVYTTVALAQKFQYIDNEYVYSNILVFGDSVQFTSSILGSSAFDNREMVIYLLQLLTGTTDSDISLYIESTEINTYDVVASTSTIFFLGIYVFTIGVPLAILITGLVIYLKRRHL